MADAYKEAGVDVHAGYETVERIKKHVARTHRNGVMGSLGGFGGLFDLSSLNYKQPVLVSGTDGVGTKLLVAIQQKVYHTIGIDCVAMCVNDIVSQGAEPIYFLDYVAVGKNFPEVIEQIVAGVSEGCVIANVALIGGETAEMPDMYASEDFDLAGFAVGIAEKDHLIKVEDVKEGDVLIGLASSGIHSNGYSLVRKILFKDHSFEYTDTLDELDGQSIGQVLLEPTKIYVKEVLALHKKNLLHGVAHITGGGFVENIPRMLPEQFTARIQMGSWPILPIFDLLKRLGNLSQEDLLTTFNLGIGMVLAVQSNKVDKVLEELNQLNTNAYVIGEVIKKTTPSLMTDEVIL